MCNTHSKPLNSPRQPRSMTTDGNIHHTWQTEHIVYNLAPAYVFSHVCSCSRASKCHDNINGTLAYATVIPYGTSNQLSEFIEKQWRCDDTRQNRRTWRALAKMRATRKKASDKPFAAQVAFNEIQYHPCVCMSLSVYSYAFNCNFISFRSYFFSSG